MRIKGLDGLRAIAFLLVLLFHTRFGTFGWVGVQLFFVLSGFLITGILLDMKKHMTTGLYFVKFYGRRFFRIIPLYYLYLVLVVLLAVYLIETQNHKKYMLMLWDQLPFAAAYVYNFFMATSLFQETFMFLTHLWSLAVEEQFYIVWPLFVFLIPFRHLKKAFWAAILLAPIFRLFVLWFYQTQSYEIMGDMYRAVYALPLSHVDAFACGALLNLAPKIPKARLQFFILLPMLPLVGMLTDYLAVGQWNIENSFGWALLLPTAYKSVWGYSLLNYVFMLLIHGVAREGWFVRFLEHAWMRYLGRISYGLYVYHYAVYWLVTQIIAPSADKYSGALLTLLFTVMIASLSFHLFERPIDRLKERWFPVDTRQRFQPDGELAR